MLNQDSQPSFQVYCHHCNVTFPLGTRHCLHCGRRVAREPSPSAGHRLMPQHESIPIELQTAMPSEEEVEPRRFPFSPIAVLWVVLFVIGTIYRACTGG
ncbi:MAG: hypothetical protein ACE5FL_07950 [Myxococcota bacterium]